MITACYLIKFQEVALQFNQSGPGCPKHCSIKGNSSADVTFFSFKENTFTNGFVKVRKMI